MYTYINQKTGASFQSETKCGGGPWVDVTPAPVAAPTENSVDKPAKRQRKKEA